MMPTPVPFEAHIAHLDGNALVVVRGEIDMETFLAFRTVLEQARAETPHLMIDMSEVTFCSSSGLGALLFAVNRVGETGSVTIRRPHPAVLRLLEITGVTGQFTIDVDEPLPAPAA